MLGVTAVGYALPFLEIIAFVVHDMGDITGRIMPAIYSSDGQLKHTTNINNFNTRAQYFIESFHATTTGVFGVGLPYPPSKMTSVDPEDLVFFLIRPIPFDPSCENIQAFKYEILPSFMDNLFVKLVSTSYVEFSNIFWVVLAVSDVEADMGKIGNGNNVILQVPISIPECLGPNFRSKIRGQT